MFVDSAADKTAILSQISTLQSIVEPGDEVVFYFSGHAAKYTVSGAGNMGRSVGIVTWGVGGDFYPDII